MTAATRIQLDDASLLRQQCYVDGEWVASSSGEVIEVDDPATGDVVGSVPALTREDTRRAIEAADAAWPAWRAMTGKQRAQLMRGWFELMMAHQEDLATLMTTEQGKPIAESRGEIAYAASFIEWFAEEAKRVYGDVIDDPLPGHRIVVFKQPIGVVASITPWNFPAAMITRKCAPARSSSDRHPRRRCPRWRSRSSPTARGFPEASSTSSRAAPARWGQSSPATRPCASSPSRDPRRWASC
jgi:succinate-semialdehyde dehydrogenase/glutarate-semialdehyde dehydrogenase